jgi:glycosyltransferase involved in cell wall biosynthesis
MEEAHLKVLHVVLSLDAGGLERVVIDLAREGRALGQSVSILCIEKPGVHADEVRLVGANLYCAEKGPGLRWDAVRKVRSILDEIHPDVIHTHQIPALLYVVASSPKFASALIHTEHNNQLKRFTSFRERAAYLTWLAIAGRRAHRLFGVSADSSQGLLDTHIVSPSKVFTVTNGIDLLRFRPAQNRAQARIALGIPAEAFVFGTVGRLNEMKRQDIFLDAFAKLSRELPSSYAVLVGDGPLRHELGAQAEKLGIADRVIFAGFQPSPEEFLAVFDVFVQTSRMEGLPLAVLEAAAAGLPVVASNVGGLEEISNSGQSILLYDFGDTNSLLSKLRQLAADPVYRQLISKSGRSHILATYSAARMAEEYQQHYLQILRTNTTRTSTELDQPPMLRSKPL